MISPINAMNGISFGNLANTAGSDGKQHKGSSGQRGAGSVQLSARDTDATGLRLSEEEKKVIQELQQRDLQVRNHEQAHQAVGGNFAGAPSYKTTKGPDNRHYATSGEVNIDMSPVHGDPEATQEKAQQIRRAALAPANPSSQDRTVAAKAAQMESAAQREKVTEAYQQMQNISDPTSWGTGISLFV